MMHKLHVLQYPGLSNISPRLLVLSVILIRSHTRLHTHFVSLLLEGGVYVGGVANRVRSGCSLPGIY